MSNATASYQQGIVRFYGSKRPPAPWVRLWASTDAEAAYNVLTASPKTILEDPLHRIQPWGLPHPGAMISITGAADDTIGQLSKAEQDRFCHGLREAARVTKGWIVTGGTESGVMKLVGHMVRQDEEDGTKTVCLGIAPWKPVRLHNQMETTPLLSYDATAYIHTYIHTYIHACMQVRLHKQMEKTPLLSYEVTAEKRRADQADLDPNHSHFVLIEDDSAGGGGFGSEIGFRTRLEDHISGSVPSVLVVMGGGEGVGSRE